MDSLSGHADRSELAAYVKKIEGRIQGIFVVHGEEDQSRAFAETLEQMHPKAKVLVPDRGQVEEI
jgi:metallo-beta-lactamase family protein